MSVTLQIANLPNDAKEVTLIRLFGGYGCVKSIRIIRGDEISLTASSYCLVEMTKGSKVKEAIRALDGQYLRGRILDVKAV